MASDILVPTLGESVSEATVAQWLKKPGEKVSADEALVELETDKVTLEVNAAQGGVLSEVLVEAGESVEVGAILGRIDESASQSDGSAKAEPAGKEESSSAASSEERPAAAGGGERLEILVPTLGESVSEATVARWLKAAGESVGADEPLVELETDKVTLEVNAPAAGLLAKIEAEEGASVGVGALLGVVEAGKGAAASEVAAQKATGKEAAGAALAQQDGGEIRSEKAPGDDVDDRSVLNRLEPDQARRTQGKITKSDLLTFLDEATYGKLGPSVRKMIEEKNLDPAVIPASGPGGRLTKEDVLNFVEGKTQALEVPKHEGPKVEAPAQSTPQPVTPSPAASAGPREERVKMTKLRQTIARRLKEAQNTAAMLTTFNEIDMSAVMGLRKEYKEAFEKKHGVRLGFTSFFTKAVVGALTELPAVNARIDGEEIVYNKFFDIGMAVSTPSGLMVPVMRDCDKKSFAEIELSLGELAGKGRDGKLTMEEMTGGSFTITNGGVFGSLLSTPILNMPQSGILGLHKIEERPVALGGQVVIRPMMYVALSYDHRIIDGREAVTFLVRVKEAMEDPRRLLLDL